MRGPVFADARTDAGFALARVDAESGTVVWQGGAVPIWPRTHCMRESALGYGPNKDAVA